MKKILLTVVLGVAVVAVAQAATQPAQQGQPAASATSSVNPPTGQAAQSTPAAAPVIKDPAEYNAYVAAYQSKDPNAKISGLEAFLTQYPNSVMKNQALEILMQAYQQANNVKKALETGTKLLAVDPCHVPSLFLLSYVDRVTSQGGDPNGKQLATDGAKYGQQGLDCLPKFAKPEGASDADFLKMKDQMKGNFHAARSNLLRAIDRHLGVCGASLKSFEEVFFEPYTFCRRKIGLIRAANAITKCF